MTDDARFQDLADAWMEDGPTEAPDRVLQTVFRAIHSTPQERGLRVPLRRRRTMIAFIGIAAAAALAAGVLTAPFAGAPSQVDASQAPPLTCPDGSTPSSGSIVTVAGGGPGPMADGAPAAGASVKSFDLAVAADGSLIFTTSSSPVIWTVGADGTLRSFLDAGGDGPQVSGGVAFDATGDLFITDPAGNHVWRRAGDGSLTLVAGTGDRGSTGNDGPALAAALENPSTIGVGPDGSVYIDDHNNYRRIDAEGVIHAFAGSLTAGFSGDDGPSVDATLGQSVVGSATDAQGDVYLGDPGNHRVRKVDPNGTITTFAGNGAPTVAGDAGPATDASINSPVAVAVGLDGSVYVADDVGGRVRRIGPDGIISTVAGSGLPGKVGSNGDCGLAIDATLTSPSSLAVGRDGRLYIGEMDGRVRAVVP
jgi:hypothetical protein